MTRLQKKVKTESTSTNIVDYRNKWIFYVDIIRTDKHSN